ncbi:helix-turn-helix domain-containing protein [Nitrosospira sp. Is2]|uniref:helix-turn-helix domain-containing protein n=1 Tax=Nitrosospira sp. Is2 TaxID=3080532 RepID=UPI002955587E|nr:helix-turn-helix domain-containing protein [Nitrosospira sp. Is2]WON75313.1 helix-turn-helix domain-containing protein [Nitrosospira sp. Is2]
MPTKVLFESILAGRAADPLLSNAEAAIYLDLAENTLPVWRCTGRYDIPYIKVGRLVKYRKSDLDAFLQRRTKGRIDAEVITNQLHPLDEVDQCPKSRTNAPGSLSEQRQASAPKRYRRSKGGTVDPPDFSSGPPGDEPRDNDEHQRTEDKRYRRRK